MINKVEIVNIIYKIRQNQKERENVIVSEEK